MHFYRDLIVKNLIGSHKNVLKNGVISPLVIFTLHLFSYLWSLKIVAINGNDKLLVCFICFLNYFLYFGTEISKTMLLPFLNCH